MIVTLVLPTPIFVPGAGDWVTEGVTHACAAMVKLLRSVKATLQSAPTFPLSGSAQEVMLGVSSSVKV